MLPFQELIAEHRELGLIAAVALGFAFGFVLERAGFGRANKLAAQFYLHDMTVFKVMFGAIVTASLGLVLFGSLGLADLAAISESGASYTYLWPMIVGGLLLGVGFIVSGYCPGTSVVASASGNMDGVMTFGGVIFGSLLYGELFPLLESFHASGELGQLFLPDVTGIPGALLAAGIAAVAVAGFFGAEKVERIFARRRGIDLPPEVTGRVGRFALASIGVLAVLALGTLALPSSSPAPAATESETIGQEQLARRILDEPWTVRVLDVRTRAECVEGRIPGAECVPLDALDDLGLPYDQTARDLVLVYSDAPATPELPAPAAAYSGRVLVLDGGFAGWREFALTKPAAPAAGSALSEREAYAFRSALFGAMTGRKAPPPPQATGKLAPKKKKKRGGGCG